MLVTPTQWLDKRFGEDNAKRPHPSSVRRWAEAGELPGKKIGGRWFIEIDEESASTGNALADQVLNRL